MITCQFGILINKDFIFFILWCIILQLIFFALLVGHNAVAEF